LSGDHVVSLVADRQGGSTRMQVGNMTFMYAKNLRLSVDSRILWPNNNDNLAQNNTASSNNDSQNQTQPNKIQMFGTIYQSEIGNTRIQCVYELNGTKMMAVNATIPYDGIVECTQYPQIGGEYVIKLTMDQVNYLTIPEKLRVLDPHKIAITDVHPRYLTEHHHNIRDVHFDVHLFGQNLLYLKPEYVRIYLDSESGERCNFTNFDVKDDVMTLRILKKPSEMLIIQIATDENMT
jgi:hypothetical protein